MSLLGERNHSDMHFPLLLTTVIGLQGPLGFPLKKKRRLKQRSCTTCPRSPNMDVSYRLDSERGVGVPQSAKAEEDTI